nr:hypothetical protein [Tanacetum cinerariifolium]
MVEFLGAIPINLKGNMWESDDLIENLIDWNRLPKEEDGAWHIRIELIDLDEEKRDELPSYVRLNFELDETMVRCTRDIMRCRDSLDQFSKVSWLATGCLVNGSPCGRIDMIIEDLDLEPKIDAMARDFLESPYRWKELSKETSSKILPSRDGSRREMFKPITSLVLKGKLK